MGATQKRIIEAIEALGEARGLSADTEYAWNNAGVVYFRQGWNLVSAVRFDFQDDMATIWVNKEANKRPESKLWIMFADGKTIEAALNAVKESLADREY